MPLLVVFFFLTPFWKNITMQMENYYLAGFRVGKIGSESKNISFSGCLTYTHNVNRVDSTCSF